MSLFDWFIRWTWFLLADERADLFLTLPARVQDLFWADLQAGIEREREAKR
jgi:hypothetical protein